MKIIDSIKFCLAKINPHYFSLLVIILIALVVTYFNLGITKEFLGDDAGVGYHYSDTQLKMVSNMWNSYTFPGRSNVAATIGLIHVGSINVLNRLGLTSIFIDRLYYFLFYFISGMGMYFLSSHICNKLFAISKNKIWFVSLIGAVFYMLNNFTMILLSFPPTNYVYSYMLLPWVFFLYLKNFHISNDLWRKLIFGITFLFLLSGNPSNTISIVFLLLLYELFFRNNNKIVHNLKDFTFTLLLTLLLSSFISLPVLGNKENPYGKVLSKDNSAAIAFSSYTTSLTNLFMLRGHHSQNTFVFYDFLLSDKIIIANYLLLVIALSFFFKKKVSKLEIFLFSTFILFLFLAKAEHTPFAWLNRLIYTKVPFFDLMYRASYFKFVYFCVFSLSILLPISLLRINEKVSRLPFSLVKKFIIIFTFLLIIFCAKPFFRGEVVRDIHKTTIPIEYHTINTYFSNIKTDFSVLSLPQLPMGLTLDWGNGNYYGGAAHPDMFMIGRPVWSNGWFLPENSISTELSFYKNMLSKSNIKYILLHKDIPESYSFEVNMKGNLGGQTNFNKFNDQIISDKNFKLIEDTRFFRVFETNQSKYILRFYTPQDVITSNQTVDGLPQIVSRPDYQIRSAIYFNEELKVESGKLKVLEKLPKEIENTPIIEFRKINPTKYIVWVHQAKDNFPLIFSESFHNGWKAYLAKPDNFQFPISNDKSNPNAQISNYKILEGNEEDQASGEELAEFIEKGWVSTLGDMKEREIKHKKREDSKEKLDYVEKYNIDFVSKNFQGTIQNDNLPSGHIWDTWFKKPLPEENHLTANGYANSWIINVEEVCKNNSCVKNPDGSYDFELIVEFWPQRLFYLGLFISGMTLLGCLGYLGYDWRRRRKREESVTVTKPVS